MSRQQSTLYREFGGVAAGPLAKLDAEMFAYVAYQCADGTVAELGDDGYRWTALSYPYAAQAMTKMLKRPVTLKQARDALGRLRGRGALLVERRRFRGHGTNWYRPEFEFLVFVSALQGPVKGRHRAGEGPTRSRDSLAPSQKKTPPTPRRAGGANSEPRGPSLRAEGRSQRQIGEAWDAALAEDERRKQEAWRAWVVATDCDPPPGGQAPDFEAWKARQPPGYHSDANAFDRLKAYRWVRIAVRGIQKGKSLAEVNARLERLGIGDSPYWRADWEFIARTVEAYLSGTLPEGIREFIDSPPKFEWSLPAKTPANG